MMENSGNSLRKVAVLSILGMTQSAHGETSLNTISIPGPVVLRILWVAAAIGFIFVITRKQKRAGNRL
jgi:hypothetical protein